MSYTDHQSKDSPSRNTPTPDLENSFFRSWALRTRNSAYSSSSDVSPGTRTPGVGPVLPKTSGPRRRDVPSRSTESHVQQVESSQHLQDITVQQPHLSHRLPGVGAHERKMLRSRGSVDTLASKASSNASSIARRAVNLMKGSPSARRPTATQGRKPSRPAKTGLAWKRELSGHWFEIRIGKKEEPDKPPTDNQQPPSHVEYSPKLPTRTTARTGRVIGQSKSKISLRPATNKSTDSSSPEVKTKKGIVVRTKAMLGIIPAVAPSTEQSSTGQDRSTADTLERASSALRSLVELTPPSGSSSNLSATSIAGKPKVKNILRPRYHRQHTGHSSNSSVRRVMLGAPPVSTPNADIMYTGSDSQQYFRVELTAPHAPTYLPSEARRIGTPPLPGSNGNSKLRGFFFDYNAPRSASETSLNPWPSEPMNTATLPPRRYNMRPPRSPGGKLQKEDPDVEWFRVKLAIGQAEDERGFELNVPEHLPSSPLCPRHPKHKSGGKGVCVYHGRNKTGPDDVLEDEGLWH
ncbi:MAG: hypothetical protein Q9209_003452 [Squamulea sp. 1 TL-2023]